MLMGSPVEISKYSLLHGLFTCRGFFCLGHVKYRCVILIILRGIEKFMGIEEQCRNSETVLCMRKTAV